ncbi:alpha/beta fold hydrolase [Polynucleobacter sp. 35-46-11]|uniref:alpha/beta fold hydrolase n=1 Tax=Polynucleobacter sp. 35-46-11 TaxID=1970425 RepID=UPI0025ECAA9D|nr:alpha/beta fold hydrolase [Polynucleobacter sp. 35-46-11]
MEYKKKRLILKLHRFIKRIIPHFLLEFKIGSSNSTQPIGCSGLDDSPIAGECEAQQITVDLPVQSKEDLTPLEVNPLDGGTKSTAPETRYFYIVDGDHSRRIAYTVSGDMHGSHVLLCLPGLLETKAAFQILHAYFLKFSGCKVISIDLPGRGESDRISKFEFYKMSLYLSDIRRFVEAIIVNDIGKPPKITVLGTSMGGVLAMYLTQLFPKNITEIVLNDIALTVNWTSLYALYKSMKHELGYRETRQLAQELQVDIKTISDVQLPGHFDLSYRADIWGMNFHEALEGYKGKVALIYGADSEICTQRRVDDAMKVIPSLSTLKVNGAGHPAPFNLIVCEFIQSEMGV